MTPDEEEALMEIQNRHSIIIKPADKGSTIVIVDKEDYAFEAMRQLQDKEFYKPLQEPIYLETQNQIVQLLKQLHKTKHINHKQLLFLTGTNLPRPRYFYLLPKIHKETAEWTKPTQIPKGRPIVSDCSSESYGSAHLINHYLNPLSNKHPSYIRDTNDFLQKVNTHNITELIHYGCGKLIYKQRHPEALKRSESTYRKIQTRPDQMMLFWSSLKVIWREMISNLTINGFCKLKEQRWVKHSRRPMLIFTWPNGRKKAF